MLGMLRRPLDGATYTHSFIRKSDWQTVFICRAVNRNRFMPILRAVLITLRAISPRFAISIFFEHVVSVF